MKKAFNKKKGFTIVELVIVVAVIGVLTAILVPTFVNLTNKANEASNQAFVKNLNTAMAMREAEEGKNKTMSEAVEDAKAIGFDVEKLTPVNGRDLVWDSVSNRFLLLEPNGDVWFGKEDKKATRDADIWKIYASKPETQKFSIYAKTDWATPSVSGLTVGFDSGYADITAVEYVGTQNVVLRTKSDRCVVTINAPLADVDFYGFAQKLDVKAVKPASLHVYGAADQLAVESGHVEIEDTGIVMDIIQVGGAETGTGASVTNNGYVAKTSLSQNTEAAKTAAQTAGKVPTNVGGDYEVSSTDRMEAFRDAVNAGNNFAEFNGTTKKVKLTADITLRDGWAPIGEGSRDVGETHAHGTGLPTWFAGFFDGQGHKISNLNNKGFVPSEKRLTGVDSGGTKKQYAWGLFGLVADGAKFQDITFENVNFNRLEYPDVEADSVGALVGYAGGYITVSGITVNGSLSGYDAVAGIVGRFYGSTTGGSSTISGCVNNATISAAHWHAAGIAGYVSLKSADLTVSGCTNNGTIFAASGNASGILCSSGKTQVLTNNTNNGNVSTNAAGRAAHICSLINQHKSGKTGELNPDLANITSTGNTHAVGAKVTVKASSETPDSAFADFNITYWNDYAGLLKTTD